MLRIKIIKKFFLFVISLVIYYFFNLSTEKRFQETNVYSEEESIRTQLRNLLEREEGINSVSELKKVNAKLASLQIVKANISLLDNVRHHKWDEKYILTESNFTVKQFQPYLKPKDKLILYEILLKLQEVCMSLHFTCFMYSGTLLGSWRHHDIIPWDGDADIMVNSTEKDELFSALSMYSPQYEIYNSGTRLKLYSIKGVRTSQYRWTWPYVDIFFFRENETHIYDEIPSKAFMRDFTYPKSVIFPLHLRPLGKITFQAPRDSFAALKITYKTTNCETHYYNHKKEKSTDCNFIEVPCKLLRNDIGFVFRTPHKLGLLEFLIKGPTIIQMILVKEPSYAISHPFNLTLL